MVTPSNYIDGSWSESEDGGTRSASSPSRPDEDRWEIPDSTEADTRTAISAALGAQDDWAHTPATERGAYLVDAANALESRQADVAEVQSRETGKTIENATSEVGRAIDTLRYYGAIAKDHEGTTKPSRKDDALVYTTHEPLGTVGIITPWNYPIAIAAWKIAPALATGNTVVQKPASASARTNAALFEAFDAAGLPDGVANLVIGSGSRVGEELVSNESIDGVSFTGSVGVGERIRDTATAHGARVQCEMGGKNPIVVDDTADLDLATNLTIKSAFRNAGQLCVAISRAIVFEDVYEEYLSSLTEAVDDLVVGDPLDSETTVGPKISESSMRTDLEFVEEALENGGRCVVGGQRARDQGWFVEPTVIADVAPDSRLAQEEVFGPVLAAVPVGGFEEALEVANDVRYGLVASICTNRLDRAKEFAARADAGMVKVNQTTGFEKQFPFGGWKDSSTTTYREQGRDALDFYTKEKTVYVSHFAPE